MKDETSKGGLLCPETFQRSLCAIECEEGSVCRAEIRRIHMFVHIRRKKEMCCCNEDEEKGRRHYNYQSMKSRAAKTKDFVFEKVALSLSLSLSLSRLLVVDDSGKT
jgi:hypothetical protein